MNVADGCPDQSGRPLPNNIPSILLAVTASSVYVPVGSHAQPCENEQYPGQPVLLMDYPLLNLDLRFIGLRDFMIGLLELFVEFSGPGVLLLFVLLNTLLYPLSN